MEFVKDYLSYGRRMEIEALKIFNPLSREVYKRIDFKVIKSILDEYYILIVINGGGNYFREIGVYELDKSIFQYYVFVYGKKYVYFNILKKNVCYDQGDGYCNSEVKIEKIEEINIIEAEALCKAYWVEQKSIYCKMMDFKLNIYYDNKIIIKEF